MFVFTVWLSTVADAVPSIDEVDVKVVVATPDVTVPVGGATVPWVEPKPTPTCGTNSVNEGTALSELWVISPVTVVLPPGAIGFGLALMPSTIHGSKSAPVPVTALQPALPGPALQPHQLFSRLSG